MSKVSAFFARRPGRASDAPSPNRRSRMSSSSVVAWGQNQGTNDRKSSVIEGKKKSWKILNFIKSFHKSRNPPTAPTTVLKQKRREARRYRLESNRHNSLTTNTPRLRTRSLYSLESNPLATNNTPRLRTESLHSLEPNRHNSLTTNNTPRLRTESLYSLPEGGGARRKSIDSTRWSLHSSRSERQGRSRRFQLSPSRPRGRSRDSFGSDISRESKMSYSSQTSRGDPIQQALEAMEETLRQAERRMNITYRQRRQLRLKRSPELLQDFDNNESGKTSQFLFFCRALNLRTVVSMIATRYSTLYQVHTTPSELVCIVDDVSQCCMNIPLKQPGANNEYDKRALKLLDIRNSLFDWFNEFQRLVPSEISFSY